MIFRIRYAVEGGLNETRDFKTPEAVFEDLARENVILGPLRLYGEMTFLFGKMVDHRQAPVFVVDEKASREAPVDLNRLIRIYESHHTHLEILAQLRAQLQDPA